jgi:hypothetical protein
MRGILDQARNDDNKSDYKNDVIKPQEPPPSDYICHPSDNCVSGTSPPVPAVSRRKSEN